MNAIEWLYIFLIINLLIGLSSWKLFKISGKNAFTSIIPFYNILNILDIIKRPRWWIILVFLPTINLLIIPVIWIEFIKRFNHSTKKDICLILFSLGFYILYINYFSKKKVYIDSKISTSGFEKSIGSFVFAIVVATIVHNYFIQPFVIPTGSLEKTLRVGDFLFVSKYHYGARVPQTVISLPLVHDTIPLIKSRSYLKKPQLPYLRLPGFQKIKQNDIVVFNWPADTVRKFFVKEKGVIKPIDKKSNYVKRTVGIPGDNFEIKDGIIYINGKENILPYRAKPLLNFKIYSNESVSSSKLINLGINNFYRKYIIDISNEIETKIKSSFKIPDINDYKEEIVFGEKLISQVFKNKNELKSFLDGRIPNWDTKRIAQIDLAIIISAIAEFIYFPLIPVKVSINEYIEISKEYSSPKSSVFINGVLDKIIKDLTKDGTISKSGRGLIT